MCRDRGEFYDAGDLDSTSRYAGTYTTKTSDGHGRTAIVTNRFSVDQNMEEHLTLTQFLPTGEVTQITQRRAGSADFVRTFAYDTLGRMVQNNEPNTTQYNTTGGVTHSWRYAYDDSGRLVGTSNAMGCGVNYHYDAGGRLIGSDFSPCKPEQPAYSAPNATNGDGFEAFTLYDEPDPNATNVVDATGKELDIASSWLWGRVASTYTRGDYEVFAYDGLGHPVGTAKKMARPGAASLQVSARYAPRWYVKDVSFDAVDRPIRMSTGAPLFAQLGTDGASDVRMTYTRRGLLRTVNSSYGPIMTGQVRDARGLLQNVTYGDAAQTQRSYQYNDLTQVTQVLTYRAPAALWSMPAGSMGPYVPPPTTGLLTTQTSLEDYSFAYDVAGNLTQAQDVRIPEEWGDKFKPASRTFEYDSYSRLTKTSYEYTGGNSWQSPFSAEDEPSSTRVPKPSPHVSFASRVTQETFTYDWLNNLVNNTDDTNGFYDRSIGTSTFGTATAPHRMTATSNRTTGSTRQGDAAVAYDAAGQVTDLIVKRNGTCLPTGKSCWQRFAYEWDEIGNLQRARRWDLTTNERTQNSTLGTALPSRTPADADLKYTYAGTSRVLKSSTATQDPKHTVYVFSTLELRSTTYSGSGSAADYTLSNDTTQVRIGASQVTARLVLDANMPRLDASPQHLFLEFGDHLGSTAFTIDRATGELVQYTTYSSYGDGESDYRSARWTSFREPYRFTGNEEDIEVGLNYHGARYYSPALHRWMSPDPVTIHSAGSDFNPYSYGYGNPTSYIDPDGRNPIVAAIVIGVIIAAATNATVQYATTGHINWGWNGVAGAALAGAVGGGIGAGVGVMTGSVAAAGAAGGAAGGVTGAAVAGGSTSDIIKSAISGAISGAVGGAIGVSAGSQSANASTAFGGSIVGTAYGTASGVAWGALTGDAPTWQSVGIAFSSAFGGAIASTALSSGVQAATESNTAGRAAETAGGGGPAGAPQARESSMAGEQYAGVTLGPNDEMHASPALRQFLRQMESAGTMKHISVMEADCKGNPTVGWGHRVFPAERAGFEGRVISLPEAEAILSLDIGNAERAVKSLIQVPLEQNQFDALVSYAFNAGSGGLQKSGLAAMVNLGSLNAQNRAFMSNTIGLGGLAMRRNAEQAIYFQNRYMSFKEAYNAWKHR